MRFFLFEETDALFFWKKQLTLTLKILQEKECLLRDKNEILYPNGDVSWTVLNLPICCTGGREQWLCRRLTYGYEERMPYRVSSDSSGQPTKWQLLSAICYRQFFSSRHKNKHISYLDALKIKNVLWKEFLKKWDIKLNLSKCRVKESHKFIYIFHF